nr:uncharacterized protein LOC120964028 [Aegilops tauschii subsp. strangulata]
MSHRSLSAAATVFLGISSRSNPPTSAPPCPSSIPITHSHQQIHPVTRTLVGASSSRALPEPSSIFHALVREHLRACLLVASPLLETHLRPEHPQMLPSWPVSVFPFVRDDEMPRSRRRSRATLFSSLLPCFLFPRSSFCFSLSDQEEAAAPLVPLPLTNAVVPRALVGELPYQQQVRAAPCLLFLPSPRLPFLLPSLFLSETAAPPFFLQVLAPPSATSSPARSALSLLHRVASSPPHALRTTAAAMDGCAPRPSSVGPRRCPEPRPDDSIRPFRPVPADPVARAPCRRLLHCHAPAAASVSSETRAAAARPV